MENTLQTDIVTEFNAVYGDGHFAKVRLGELIHKGGAAGKIYLNADNPNQVVKIFHSKSKSNTNRQKLEAMLLNRPHFPDAVIDGINYVQIAWPEALLEDENGFCVGYLMPFIKMSDAVSLDHLMQKAIRKKLNLPESYAYRIFAAYNLASMVTALHKCEHYIVDLKPSNVSVYKNNMMVAMVDCDGFSIKGEFGRYPAEFVSEEYIYPEGMEQNCADMGEEQDKFALAVIIFRLLNNGIHPFSGTPRKNDEEMLTIQDRIEQYHYAYGLWPDAYQAPHPYSIHEYFDKATLEMFERAFTKSGNRPTAQEWQEHLWKLMHNLKICKKDKNHVYFTSKGCGLCMVEDKFYHKLSNIKKQKETPEMVRGMEIGTLTMEHIQKDKEEKLALNKKMQIISYTALTVYMLFFAFLYKILTPIAEQILAIGLGLQAIIVTLIMLGINYAINKYYDYLPILKNRAIMQMIQVYALICIIIALVSINDIPQNLLDLALPNS